MDLTAASTSREAARVTDMLEMVAAAPGGVRLNRLVAELDTPKSWVLDTTRELVASGYLTDNDGVFALGPAVANLLVPGRWDFVHLARPILTALRDECDETAILATNIGESVVNVDMVEAAQAIRYSAPLHVRRTIFPSSAGKVFLAHWESRRREAFLQSRIADPLARRKAARELTDIRIQGIAFNHGETAPDVSAVAGPVVLDGTVVAAVVIAGPSARIEPRISAAAAAVRAATVGLADSYRDEPR